MTNKVSTLPFVFALISFLLCVQVSALEISLRERDYLEFDSDEDFNRRLFEVNIDRTFRRGNHLIYDCLLKRFACVNLDGRNLCLDWRAEDIRDEYYFLRCALMQSFTYYEECRDAQYRVMHTGLDKNFCLNLDMEKKRLKPF